MIADRFWELLSKTVFAEASDTEVKEFEEILSSQPHLKDTAETLTILALQSSPIEKDNIAEQAFEKHIEKIKELSPDLNEPFYPVVESEIDYKKAGRSKVRKWFIPAGVLATVLLFFFIFRGNIISSDKIVGQKSSLNQVTTKPGSKTQIQLPDGSSVWLNASSSLTYEKDFGKDFREVNLIGEAFFDVAKDAAHPFIIHTKVIDVKVLGTEFNVKAYPNDAYTETSLIRGSVEVTVKNRANEKHYLKPNEKMSVANGALINEEKNYARSTPIVSTEPLTYYRADSTIIETSWVENKLIFQENESFKEVAQKMERWYGVHIGFADEQVAKLRPFGSFTNETIVQALDALRESFGFRYSMNGNNIIISK